MRQTHHLQFRYLQRIHNMTDNETINQYIKDNYYKIYHDINEMFTSAKPLVENWQTFSTRNEKFSYYIYKHKFLFVVEDSKQEGRTITNIGDNKIVSQAIHQITLINDQINKYDKFKREVDAKTRSFEWVMKNHKIDLKNDIVSNVTLAQDYVEKLKELKLSKRELVYGLAVDYEVLLEQLEKIQTEATRHV